MFTEPTIALATMIGTTSAAHAAKKRRAQYKSLLDVCDSRKLYIGSGPGCARSSAVLPVQMLAGAMAQPTSGPTLAPAHNEGARNRSAGQYTVVRQPGFLFPPTTHPMPHAS